MNFLEHVPFILLIGFLCVGAMASLHGAIKALLQLVEGR